MSNAVRYDSFLVHHLALELNAEHAGKPIHGLQFDSADQRLLLDIDDVRIVWELHAASGALVRTAPLYPLPNTAILPRRAKIRVIDAIEEERVLRIELTGEPKDNATFQVIVELITNQWNAFALDHDGRVLRLLKLREAGRSFRRGQLYTPPARPDQAQRTYRSPLNQHVSDEQFEQMLAEAPLPALVDAAGLQPYPHPMWLPQATRFDSLLAAFAAMASETAAESVVAELQRRVNTSDRKIERLRDELDKALVAEQTTRERAAVLLAYATTITRGAARVILPGFSGGEVEIVLNPGLSAVENAQALYAQARKHERASKRIPTLLNETEAARARSAALLARARRGELTDTDLKEIAARPTLHPQQSRFERLPYRRYFTSGGLEVRVGRNARSNDELTLRHASARDIWLHARHVGGAHVVLRWNDANANPPQSDIVEAAILAALHSAARTSATVPVDYTRRKYVRKPRRSPPGTVTLERARTIFVEPDPELEQRLRG